MKWFQHNTDARQDPKLQLVKSKFGAEGYGVYFQLVEIVAQNVKPENQDDWGKVEKTYDFELLAAEIGIALIKLKKMVKFFDKIGLTTKEGNQLAIPTIRKNLDEYTKKQTANQRPKKKSLKTVLSLRGSKLKNPDSIPTVSRHTPDQLPTVSGNTIHNNTIQDIINNGKATKVAIDEKKAVLNKTLKKKFEPTAQWQDRALLYAEKLGIDLDKLPPQANYRGRWFKAFKISTPGKLSSAYSYLSDHPKAKELTPEQKIKLFFWRVANG